MTRAHALRRPSRLLLVAGPGLLGALALGGVASAYLLGDVAPSGAGAAAAANGTVTMVVTASSTAALYPGGPAGDVTVTVANTYDRPVTITAVTAGTPVVTGAAGCTDADVTAVTPSAGLPLTVAAGATSAPVVLSNAVRMGTAAQSACQGATITVPLTLTGRL